MKTVDKYLFQALDNYPYWLEGTIESLDYALSYNDKNVMALCLYGRIQTEQLHDYEEAKRYFQEALAIDINAVAVYPYYLDALLLNEDYDEALKLIDFALTIKGINKVSVMILRILRLNIMSKSTLTKRMLMTMNYTFQNIRESLFGNQRVNQNL